MFASATKSSTPVTVTVCGVFQLPAVNVTDEGETVPSAVLELDRPIVTVSVGCELSLIVKVALPLASVVTKPDVGFTVMPATSLSRFVTEMDPPGVRPLYTGSALTAAPGTIRYATSPSTTKSSMPVIVIVCGVAQLAGVNVREAGEETPSA